MKPEFVYWRDGELWLGYLKDDPDSTTQAHGLKELEDNLRELDRGRRRHDSRGFGCAQSTRCSRDGMWNQSPRTAARPVAKALWSSWASLPSRRSTMSRFTVLMMAVTTDGYSRPASCHFSTRWSPGRSRDVLLVTAATTTSCRRRLNSVELRTTTGRRFASDSSVNTNLTNATSPGSQIVIGGVSVVGPELRQHGVGRRGKGNHPIQGSFLTGEIAIQAFLQRLDDVAPQRRVAMRRGEPETTLQRRRNIDRQPDPLARTVRHRHRTSGTHITTNAGERRVIGWKGRGSAAFARDFTVGSSSAISYRHGR